jgi:hypothetical protein
MCDFSSKGYSRPAKVGDKLVTRDFGTGTRGSAAPGDLGLAVCYAGNGTGLRRRSCMPADRSIRVEVEDNQPSDGHLSTSQQRQARCPITTRSNFRMGGPCC